MKKMLLLLLSMLVLTSCSPSGTNNSEVCTLYYFENDDKNSLISVTERLEAASPEQAVYDIFTMLTKPENKKYAPAISEKVKLINASVSNGVCNITLSYHYINLPVSSKIAMDACLTNTLCSLSYIDRVIISCEGISYAYTSSDFITDTPRTYYDTHTVNLYFANESFDGLYGVSESISIPPGTTLEKVAVSRLLSGPASDSLQSAIPHGTQLNDIYVSEGVCVIDLSAEFVSNAIHDATHEEMTLYSIVNTVTELPMINSVKFLIDGNQGSGYIYFDISKTLTNRADIIKK